MKIPIAALKSLATIYRQQHIIMFSQGHGTQHIVTYGDTAEHCSQAADLGNDMKKGLGWPDKLQAQPSRVRRLQNKVEELQDQVEAAKSSGDRWEEDCTAIAALLGIKVDVGNVDYFAQQTSAAIEALKFIAREVAAYGDCDCKVGENTCVYCTSVNLSVSGALALTSEAAEETALVDVKSVADDVREKQTTGEKS